MTVDHTYPFAKNLLRERLNGGHPCLCFRVATFASPEIAYVAHAAGFDAIYVDLEHSSLSPADAARIATAAAGLPITMLVRIPTHGLDIAGVMLDAGAKGIIVPHVQDADAAKTIVAACRFPPLGRRSVGGPSILLGYEDMPMAEQFGKLEGTTFIGAMIETSMAVTNAASIAAVPGIDMLFIGMQDLMGDYNLLGQNEAQEIQEAVAEVAHACKLHGKTFGIGGVSSASDIERYVTMGARFISAASDNILLLSGAKARVSALKQVREYIDA